ncbi:ComF family protein [Candidatus Nomurabacteria bacterium]|nr:ComF family protein [Candidatus Nomurabacteria bacterium]
MNDIFACFHYQEPIIKKLLHSLKYYKKQNIGLILGGYLYERLIEEIAELHTFSQGSEILLIPVPLSHKRYKERGYNQAEIIAKGIIRNDKEKIFVLENKIISKVKDTLPQAKINNRNKRLKNVIGCFTINNREKIKGRTVVVVDDVTTTGGTINEIMKLLKKSGAKKVVGFAVAH